MTDNNKRYVYILECPLTYYVGYIGITRDIDKIRHSHISRWAYSKGNPAKNKWIRTLIAAGCGVRILELACTTKGRAKVIRRQWFERLARQGAPKPGNIDKSQKCRDIALRLWSDINFALKVKAGLQRRKERLEANKLKPSTGSAALVS